MDRLPTISKVQQQLQVTGDLVIHDQNGSQVQEQNSYQQQLQEQTIVRPARVNKYMKNNDVFYSPNVFDSQRTSNSLTDASQQRMDQSSHMKRVPLKDSSKFFVNGSNTPTNTTYSNALQKKSLLDQRAHSISKQSHPFLVQQQQQQQQQQQLQQQQQQQQQQHPHQFNQPQGTNTNTGLLVKREKTKTQQNRMTGEELRNWQQSWRKIMKISVVYFENDEGKNEKDKMRAKLALESLGASFERFFSENVTIIISKRFYDRNLDYPKGDIFRVAKRNYLKVWTYEKVFKFMNDLGEPVPEYEEQLANRAKLSSLLQHEKLFGPNDRDPNAKRDDIKYFTGLYYYIYDLRQQTRPVAIREWPKSADNYPRLYNSSNGRSLFLEDPAPPSARRYNRRKAYLDETKDYRNKLIESFPHPVFGVFTHQQRSQFMQMFFAEQYGEPMSRKEKAAFTYSLIQSNSIANNPNTSHGNDNKLIDITNCMDVDTNTELNNRENETLIKKSKTDENDDSESDSTKDQETVAPLHPNHRHPHPTLLRNDSMLGTNQSQNKFNNEFGEIEASGVVQQSNSAVFGGSNTTNNPNKFGNGLGATTSTVLSKKLVNDKRKVINLAPTPIPIPKPTAGFFGGPPVSPTNVREAQSARKKDGMKIVQIRREDKIVKVVDIKRDSKFVTSEEAAALSSTSGENKENNKLPETATNTSTNTADQGAIVENENKFTTPTKKSKKKESRKRSIRKRESLDDIEILPTRQKKSRYQMKPGYCENCRVKYDDFDDHIVSDKHRQFALDSDNFYEIDNLISDVHLTRMMSL